MKRKTLLLGALLCLCWAAQAGKPIIVPLWPSNHTETSPTGQGKNEGETRLANIPEGTIIVSLPEQRISTGAAVIICPGGAYITEAMVHEGFQAADWFNQQGIVAIVLKYRLPNGHSNIPLSDAKRAIRLVRARAKEWKIDPNKIAIAGFSAGGHLASTAGTHFDYGNLASKDSIERYSSRPDMMILFYPVISMKKGMSHAGSRENLLGKKPTVKLENEFSNEQQVKADTPPTIIFHSDDDKSAPPANSLDFYKALKEKNIPASLHIFPTGGHGWGMNISISFHEVWRSTLQDWLRNYQYIK
jgi:acetyl esterase/lipase